MRFLAAVILVSLAVPAFAAARPELAPEVCQMMVAHEPVPDVAYKPGVDVAGKPIVEADIVPSPVEMPESVTFDITIDFAQYVGLEIPAGVKGDANVGTIVVDKDGHITFNDKPLEGDADKTLRALCKEEQESAAVEEPPIQKH